MGSESGVGEGSGVIQMTHDELAKLVFAQAKHIVEVGQNVPPMLALWNGSLALCPLPWNSHRQKTGYLEASRETLAEDLSISVYALVSEMWFTVIPKAGDAPIVRPTRDDPNRREGLMVTSFSRTGGGVCFCAEIKTGEGGKRTVGEVEEMPGAQLHGPLVNLFAPLERPN